MTDPMRPRLIDVEGATITASLDRRTVVSAAFEEYHDELYHFLCRATRDQAAAEDLLQDAFLRLTREVEAGRTPDQIRAWLYRVASNLAISRGRRHQTVIQWLNRHGRAELDRTVDSPEANLLGRERRTAIDAALASLPADARTALLLSAEGFSGEEIAAAIGRTHGATRTLMARARVRVRLQLEGREDVR